MHYFLYQNIDKLKGKQKESLEQFEEQVRMSRKLAEIIIDVPVEFNQEDLSLSQPDFTKLRKIFLELEFRTLAERVLPAVNKTPEPVPAPAFEQGTLFSLGEQTQTESPGVHSDIKSTSHNYILVDSEEKVTELISSLGEQTSFCFDTETTGLDTQSDQLVGLSFSFKPGEAYYVPVPADKKKALSLTSKFKDVFANEAILKIGQNMKFDILILSHQIYNL